MAHIIFHYDNGKTYKATGIVSPPRILKDSNIARYVANKTFDGITAKTTYEVPLGDVIAIETRGPFGVHVDKIKKNRISINISR